jgi:O-antigen ligase
MPSTTYQDKVGTRATPGGRRWLWIAIPFVFIGCLACAQLFGFGMRFHDSGFVIIVGALVGLPVLVALVYALRVGFTYARAFLPTLRWWHLLWVLMVVSAMVFRRRTAADITADPLDAWAVFRVAIDMVVALVLLARLALRRTHWIGSMFRGALCALSVYGLVCLASTAWSVFPSWTIFKSLEYLLDLSVVGAILETFDSVGDYRNFFNWTWTIYGLLLLSVWKDVLFWPREALYQETLMQGAALGVRLSGVLPAASSNDVATFSSILAVLCLARLFPASEEEQSNKIWYTLLLLVSMISLVMSQTRAALVGVVFASFLILLFSKRGKLGAFVTLVVAPTLALLTMGGLIWTFVARGQTAAQMDTLSNRTEWWGLAWRTFLERPLTGFGAYAAGRFAVLAKAGFGGTGTMHSDYLEVIVGTGIWGLIPLVVALAATWWLILRFVRNSSDPEERQLAHEALAILALLTLRSVTNNMITVHPPLAFLAILGFAEFVRRRRNARIAYASPYRRGTVALQGDSAADLVPELGE